MPTLDPWAHRSLPWTTGTSSQTPVVPFYAAAVVPVCSAVDMLDRLPRTASGEWVFPGAVPGRPLSESALYSFWLRVRDEAGIVADARLHDLRHSHASHAIMNSESVHMAGRLLGQRRAATTNCYAHLDDATLNDAAERVALAVERKLGILGNGSLLAPTGAPPQA